jgi:hypothetical protein
MTNANLVSWAKHLMTAGEKHGDVVDTPRNTETPGEPLGGDFSVGGFA